MSEQVRIERLDLKLVICEDDEDKLKNRKLMVLGVLLYEPDRNSLVLFRSNDIPIPELTALLADKDLKMVLRHLSVKGEETK